MRNWSDLGHTIRREAHFGDRVVECFAERPATYFDMVEAAVQKNPNGEALIFCDERLTWQQLEARALSFAHGLLKSGIRPKDRIALFITNRIEFVVTLFACARIGAIIVPISPREEKGMLLYFLQHSGAVAIVCERRLVEKLPARDELPELRLRLCPEQCEGAVLFSTFYEADSPASWPDVSEEDTLTINYTSGTTGVPKGVPFSHLGIIHAAMHYTFCVGLSASDRSVLSIPLNFVGGVISAFSPLVYCGGTVILLSEFKASQFLMIAARERMTHTLMVPAMYELCLRQPGVEQFDLSSWQHGVYGAAPMPTTTILRLKDCFPRLRLMNSYGATEGGGPATFLRAEDTAEHPDSVGQAMPCVELAVMDEKGRELPPGAVGELWIRSPGCSAGFWNDPERTQAEYFGGFWRSGDIATLGDDGLVRLVDRKKDMINRGGYKISSIQVENVLHCHPSVIEAAVIGKPDPVLGERVLAFVWTGKAEGNAADLRAFCTERLPDYKVPEFYIFLDAPLPRNANGKLLKRVLRDHPDAQ